eukprot:scaffold71897_cov31-Tisochrysis_lutea.AAC.1
MRQPILVDLNDVGDLEEQVGSIGDGCLRPAGPVGCVCRLHCPVDVCLGPSGRLDEGLAVDWRFVVKVATVGRLSELAADEEAVARGQAEVEARCH